MLERLYVCPCCFKYSKELVSWWEHVRVCERKAFVPGEKIYVHPRQKKWVKRVVATELPAGASALDAAAAGAAAAAAASAASASKPTKPAKGGRKKKKDDSAPLSNVQAVMQDVKAEDGEWSIWQVDGEKDVVSFQAHP